MDSRRRHLQPPKVKFHCSDRSSSSLVAALVASIFSVMLLREMNVKYARRIFTFYFTFISRKWLLGSIIVNRRNKLCARKDFCHHISRATHSKTVWMASQSLLMPLVPFCEVAAHLKPFYCDLSRETKNFEFLSRLPAYPSTAQVSLDMAGRRNCANKVTRSLTLQKSCELLVVANRRFQFEMTPIELQLDNGNRQTSWSSGFWHAWIGEIDVPASLMILRSRWKHVMPFRVAGF